jgi:hypothetical protein
VPAYLDQFERVNRWYARFEAIDNGRPHDSPSDNYVDDIYALFLNCYHLKDWIRNDFSLPSSVRDAVETHIDSERPLRLCADICNSLKHLRLTKHRSGQNPSFGKKRIELTLGPGFPTTTSLRYEVETDTGPIDAFDLATQCVTLETVKFFSGIAKATFEHSGLHVPMLFPFNEKWQLLDMVTAQLSDQTDKFIFWRTVADRVGTLRAYALVWIAESWLRELINDGATPIRNMPIFGERLSVLGLDKAGNTEEVVWDIVRPSTQAPPTLQLASASKKDQRTPFFLLPVTRVMGLPDPAHCLFSMGVRRCPMRAMGQNTSS